MGSIAGIVAGKLVTDPANMVLRYKLCFTEMYKNLSPTEYTFTEKKQKSAIQVHIGGVLFQIL